MITPKHYGDWALIAGASEGVGASFAHKLARAGFNLVLVARRTELLTNLSQKIRAQNGIEVRTLSLDLKASDVLERIRMVTDDVEIGVLIFNASDLDTMRGSFVDRALDNILASVRVTVVSQTVLVHHFGSRMAARGRGGIILVGSLSGNAGMPLQATYCAAKAYTQILAESLWCELRGRGVDVLSLVLGSTDTPARKRNGIPHVPGFPVLSSDDAAQQALDHLADGGPVHVPSPYTGMFQYLCSTPRREIAERLSGAATGRRQNEAERD